MNIWGLFDDGNGCYKQAVDEFNMNEGGQHKLISIGIGDACIKQDLAVNTLHQPMALWDVLDRLEPPDVILASPPCESWSVASAMKGGNACWKQEQGITTSLFGGYEESSKFTIRNKDDYSNYQFKYDKSFLTRINGEMCIYNTLKIIDHYKPKIFVIENPAYGAGYGNILKM
jgi:DNA methylase (fragment)